MQQTTSVVLPFPISTNSLYRNVRGVGRVKTARYRKWVKQSGLALLMQKPRRIKGRYHLHIDISDSRTLDLDNAVKCISDLLVSSGVVEDDSMMERLVVNRLGIEGARVMVVPQ